MFEEYVLYLMSFMRHVTDSRKEMDPVSPFTYEEWIMCGMPSSYIPGLALEDNQYLTIIDSNNELVGYVKLDERMASVIAEGINSGRYKIRKSIGTPHDDNAGKNTDAC